MRPWRLLAGIALALGALAAQAGLQVELARVARDGLIAHGVRIDLPADEGGAGKIHIERLQLAGRVWRRLALHCAALSLTEGRIACRQGRLRGLPALGVPRIDLSYDTAAGAGTLRLALAGGGRIVANLSGDGRIQAQLIDLSLAAMLSLAQALPEGWQVDGRLDGEVALEGDAVRVNARLHEAAFSDPSGLHAGEGLAVELAAALRGPARQRDWQVSVDWLAGESFWSPILLGPGWRLSAQGRWQGDRLTVDAGRLEAPGLRQARFSARADLAAPALVAADVQVDEVDLARWVPQFVLPLILPDQQARWRVAGSASAQLRWRDGAPESLRLDLDGAGFSYLGQRFRVGPFSGSVPWQRDQPSHARLAFEGLHWQKLDFAPFVLEAELSGTTLALAPARLPVLDGAVVIEALSLAREAGQWSGQGRLFSEPISLRQLTTALDLPEMAGSLSASIPGVRFTPERIGFDGAVVVSAFDGYLQATGLEVVDPFGLLPRLSADIRAEHLDLEQLTETFSFGAVSGFVDARVDDLVMAAWRPVRFDAQVRSAAGDYRRRISQRAVEHITALGGAGAMAAIQRSMLMFFNDFGYREIGFGCRLRGNVCLMSGLDGPGGDAAPFMLVQGGGVPALNVIGYNRRVDWTELVDRLLHATAGGAEPVVK
jgi:hypothetical protein